MKTFYLLAESKTYEVYQPEQGAAPENAGSNDTASVNSAEVQQPQSNAAEANPQGSMLLMVGYIVVLVAVFYFLIIKPQKKRSNELKEIQEAMKPGDEVMTSSGFFGKVAEIGDEKVLVEFGSGSSRSIRIPVKKSEIYGCSSVKTEEEKKKEKEDAKKEEKKDKKEKE
ncbi:MAG: preprotein translocase subunit YajC [Firmicutes bacterium]|nr:preprotein translocase subunit YajC [Bacillota bacterium]